MKILFWDIDGTLIRTGKAGLYAFSQATAELWGQEVDYGQIATAGMTDNYIARQIIENISGRKASWQEIDSLCRRYEQLLPRELAVREGLVLPGVAEILSYLQYREDCRLLLLTGNSRQGAQIKLEYFALAQYFDFDNSAFAGQYEQRNDIAGQALATVLANWGEAKQHEIYVLGDTPHDIACGKSIGAYTIGIATGRYSLPELDSAAPWWGVQALPAPELFTAKIGG